MRNLPVLVLLVGAISGAASGFLAATVPAAFASRNSSGTYSLPAGNPVVTGTTIQSSWANNTLSDVGTELTSSLDRSGRGAMLAKLQLFAGTSSAPGLTFASDTDTGLYRNASNDIRFGVDTTYVQKWTSSGVTLPLALTVNGTATLTPSSAAAAAVITGNTTANAVEITGGTTGDALLINGSTGATASVSIVGNGSATTGYGEMNVECYNGRNCVWGYAPSGAGNAIRGQSDGSGAAGYFDSGAGTGYAVYARADPTSPASPPLFLEPQDAEPTGTCNSGEIYYNGSAAKFYGCAGSVWVAFH